MPGSVGADAIRPRERHSECLTVCVRKVVSVRGLGAVEKGWWSGHSGHHPTRKGRFQKTDLDRDGKSETPPQRGEED